MKNARRKLEIPMPATMPSRPQLHQHRETCGKIGQHKTKCVDRNTSHVIFLLHNAHAECVSHHMAQDRVCAHHPISMVIHDERLIDRMFSLCSAPCSLSVCLSFTLLFSSHFNLYSVLNLFSSMWTTPRQWTTAPPPNEEWCPLAEFTLPTKYACIVEADESMRIRLEGSQSKNHEDHIARKGMTSLSHHNLVHKFNPMLEAMKIPDAKAAVENEREKSVKIPTWQLRKVKDKREVIASME